MPKKIKEEDSNMSPGVVASLTSRPSTVAPGDSPSDECLLTAEEISRRLGIHVKTVYLSARNGALPSRRRGGAVRFVWAEVDQALREEAEEYVEARRKNENDSDQDLCVCRGEAGNKLGRGDLAGG